MGYYFLFQVTGGGEIITLFGVLFGDVWLCSGQSNMEQSMENIMNSTEEIEASAKYDHIRYKVVANTASDNVDDDADIAFSADWSKPSSPNRPPQTLLPEPSSPNLPPQTLSDVPPTEISRPMLEISLRAD